jgi:CRP-like cAMP-binding protein
LYQANEPIEFVHFIEAGVASLVNTMRNGDSAAVGTIGNEGMFGLPIVFGDKKAPTSAYMQVAGASLKLKASVLREEMRLNDSLKGTMLHYAHAFFNQVAQSVACNALHTLEQRFCRWLLMTLDRAHSTEFYLTQEFLALMLGVRRAGVGTAANALKRDGLIHYTRGRIALLDPEALQKRSCECYSVTKREFDHLLGADLDKRLRQRDV